MKPNTRVCVAYLAGRLITGSDVASVYESEGEKPVGLDELLDSGVKMYPQSGNIRKGGHGLSFKVIFHEEGHCVDLSINGPLFSGYDYGTGCFFAGKVKEEAVCLYDFGALAHFHYRLCRGGVAARPGGFTLEQIR